MRNRKSHRSGFSLLELVIVVVIIGIIAAIAIPRMSRGAAGASDSALSGNLAVIRNAIDMYAAEHSGSFPTVASATLTYYLEYTTNLAGLTTWTTIGSTPGTGAVASLSDPNPSDSQCFYRIRVQQR